MVTMRAAACSACLHPPPLLPHHSCPSSGNSPYCRGCSLAKRYLCRFAAMVPKHAWKEMMKVFQEGFQKASRIGRSGKKEEAPSGGRISLRLAQCLTAERVQGSLMRLVRSNCCPARAYVGSA